MRGLTSITRRRAVKLAAASAAAGAFGFAGRAEENILYVNSWGGSMEEAEVPAYFQPFTSKTGIRIRPVSPVSFAKLKAQVQSRHFEWDVSSTGKTDVQAAVHEGLLEPIDFSIVDRSKLAPDMIYGDHSIANMSLAIGLVYRKDRFPNGGPQSWADFWDVKQFPGTRSLYTRSYTNLSFALLADGVPIDKLYPLDLDRAFRKMDEIKPHIKVWWQQGSQSQQLIRDGEVDMICMWNARAQELIDQGLPLEIVWNQAENAMGTWFVPKGTPRAKWAWEFINLAVQPDHQAAFCNRLPYGPSNPRAFEFISPENARKMPTWPPHLRESFSPDDAWLATRMTGLRERWAQWMVS
jgi:putative spermidine/putrescine transport system substrate-binding protein